MTQNCTFFEDWEGTDDRFDEEFGGGERFQRVTPAHLPPSPKEVGTAAFLYYCDIENNEGTARRLGISRRTLLRWKRRPEFVAAITAVSEYHRWQWRREMLARLRRRFAG